MNIRVKQRDASDCGAASIASICRHYNKFISVSRIRILSATDQSGTSVAGLVSALTQLGFEARAVRTSLPGLTELGRMSIAHVIDRNKLPHFMVVVSVDSTRVVVMDPRQGRIQTLATIEFTNIWTGILIVIKPTERLKDLTSSSTPATQLLNLVLRNKKELLKAMLLASAYTILGLTLSFYIKYIVDHVIPFRATSQVQMVSGLVVLICIVQALIGIFKNLSAVNIGLKIDLNFLTSYIRQLFHLPLTFYETVSAGELLSRVNDAAKIRLFVTDTLLTSATNVLIILFSLTAIFLFSPPLGLLSLLTIPLYLIIYLVTNMANRANERLLMERSAAFQTQVIEDVNLIRSIRQFNLATFMLHKTEDKLRTVQQSALDSSTRNILSAVFTDSIARILVVLTLWMGAALVVKQQVTTGELLSVFALTSLLAQPIVGLIGTNKILQDALIASDRLYEINDLAPVDDTAGRYLANNPTIISFQQVGFQFPNCDVLFDNINFTLHPGTITAVIGCSGVGKSTLLSMMQKIYVPSSGKVLVGDTDITHIRSDSLRRLIGVVPQRPEIFNASVVGNIAPGDPEPDLTRVMQICSQLGLLPMIEQLPLGFKSILTGSGARLSGGQQQLLVIARALYREPSILLLDEPTSQLDPVSANLVHKMMVEQKAQGKSILVATHRPDTIRMADQIILLSNGVTAELGTHEELLRANGEYARVWQERLGT